MYSSLPLTLHVLILSLDFPRCLFWAYLALGTEMRVLRRASSGLVPLATIYRPAFSSRPQRELLRFYKFMN